MSPRTEQQLEEIRKNKKQIIREAALHCFSEGGLHKTSISQIAKKANVSKGLIYNYYESKEAMVHDIVEDIFSRVFSRMDFMDKHKFEDEDMARFIGVSLDIVAEDPVSYRIYFKLLTEPDILAVFMEDTMKRMAPMIQLFHNYYVEKGYEDPLTMMKFYSAAIDGVQMHILLSGDFIDLEPMKKLMTEILTRDYKPNK